MKLLLFLFLSSLSLAANVCAEQVITLKDCSQIKGDLVGVKDDVYTVKTSTLGEINVSSSQVANISNPHALPASIVTAPSASPIMGAASSDISGQVQAAQAKLMADPQTMTEIQALVQDPEITQLLSDPTLLQAVTAKDPAAVQSNPKAQALMQNPKMRALMDKLQQQQK